MGKKPELNPKSGFLRCDECSHVTEVTVVPFSALRHRTKLSCGCQDYAATAISKSEGIDALARQHVEGMAA